MVVTTPKEPTTIEKLRGLPWSIAGDTGNTVFAQLVFFGSVFILFLDKLGLNKTQIGSLLSLIPFCALIALFIAPTVARWGYKRTFITFWGARKTVSVFLLLTPWVTVMWGPYVATVFVAAITAGFALSKAVADTAILTWIQEYIPDHVRGRYYAMSNLYTTIAAFLTISTASFVMSRTEGLTGFMLLIGIGVVFGFFSLWAYARIPGGAPRAATRFDRQKLMAVARDRNFWGYMLGVNLIVVGFAPLLSFLPLFMHERVGLSESSVVMLQTGNLAGGLLAGYLWGWTSDRYGSKPVMMSGLFIRLILPLLWFTMPHHSGWSLYVALGIAALQGIGDVAWSIGSARLLFVSVVPAAQNVEYMALYYAIIGLVSGLSQLLGGWALDLTAGVSGEVAGFTIDSYTVLMAAACVLTASSLFIFQRVRGDSPVGIGQFAGLFMHGNPVRAIDSVIRYYKARDERAMVFVTEQLGQTKSHLAVDELLDALQDPRFNVRFEAIISMARMPTDPRLTEALIKVLHGKSPALSVVAAWALGRTNDPQAIAPLRTGLDSEYRSIQSHSARALATLGDAEIAPLLLERLPQETDEGLQLTYASALGKLGVTPAMDELLPLLVACTDATNQQELALAVARLVGSEDYFIRLWRQASSEPGTALAQALTALKRKLIKLVEDERVLSGLVDSCSETFAQQKLEEGAQELGRLIEQLPVARLKPVTAQVLTFYRQQIAQAQAGRREYLLLALQALNSDLLIDSNAH